MKSLQSILPAEDELEKRLRKTSIFVGKLLLVGLVFRAVLFIRPDTYLLQSWLASFTSSILSVLGIDLQVQGALLIGAEESYIVNQDCLGWKSVFAFFGLMVASTRDISADARYILTGIIAILLINIVRVVTTVYLSHYNIISFEIIHTLLWRWGLTVIVFTFWIFWFLDLGPKIREHLYTGASN